MIIVTGGFGFVGANVVHELNRIGEQRILVVDNLAPNPATVSPKFHNLHGARFLDFMDKHEFRRALAEGKFNGENLRAILHNGACSNTLEDDGRYMMDNNFTYSKELFHFAAGRGTPFVYASTAAVYGLQEQFAEEPAHEKPLNIYGYSKLVFDNYVRAHLQSVESTVVGLRYFNVYGPYEQHKGRMASVIYHFTAQLKKSGTIRMFQGSGGYGDGEQRRDFVYVRDLARINLFFAGLGTERSTAPVKAIVNAGTGQARTFKEVGQALIAYHGGGNIEYVPMPPDLHGRYQHFTQADPARLRAAGWAGAFTSLEDGIAETFTIQPYSE